MTRMSDDLISRKEALQVLEDVFGEYRMSWGREYGGFGAAAQEVIEELPTAFDKEKVINEICNVPHGYYNTETENEIIEIIEKGGIE